MDDGSKDGTDKYIRKHFPDIFYVRHRFNRGGGAALETGLEFVRRHRVSLGIEFVVTFDADGQHNIDDISIFLSRFKTEPTIDIIFGSRFIQKTNTNVPLFRKIILMGGKWFTKFISGVTLTDSHNGYRMFRSSILDNIQLTMDGMEYASEFIDLIHERGYRIAEVPVNIRYDEYSLGKGQKSSNAINIAFKMIWKKFFQ